MHAYEFWYKTNLIWFYLTSHDGNDNVRYLYFFCFRGMNLNVVFSCCMQARLAFCKFMVKPSTLLILDEPTNHLDIPSKEMLEVWFFFIFLYSLHLLFFVHYCSIFSFLSLIYFATFRYNQEAIREYSGTVITVSHDRYFIRQIVNRVVEVKDGHLQDYAGDYNVWLSSMNSSIPSL